MPRPRTYDVRAPDPAAPQYLAIDASKVLVDLETLSKSQTSCNWRAGRSARRCYAGGAADPPRHRGSCGRSWPARPADPGSEEAARSRSWRGARRTRRLSHDGRPENWKVIDTPLKAKAQYIIEQCRLNWPTRRIRRAPATSSSSPPPSPVRHSRAWHAVRAVGVLRPARLRGKGGPARRTCATFPRGGSTIERGEIDEQPDRSTCGASRVPARHPGAAARPGIEAVATCSTTSAGYRRCDQARNLRGSLRSVGGVRRRPRSATPGRLLTLFNQKLAARRRDAAAARRRQRRACASWRCSRTCRRSRP